MYCWFSILPDIKPLLNASLKHHFSIFLLSHHFWNLDFNISTYYCHIAGICVSVDKLLYTKQFNNEKDLYSKFSFENFGYIIEPHTWFDNIKSLKSGHYIIIKETNLVALTCK